MTVIVETDARILVGSQAFLLEEDRELAWAEKYVRRNPAFRWVVGNFVEAEKANDNGHIFPLDDLIETKDSLQYSPLNMLHRAGYIVGAFAATEMIYPVDGVAAGSVSLANGPIANPYMEALAAFYRYYFPEEAKTIESAHKNGSLYFSMEAVPQSLQCATCEKEFAYDGRQSPTYCPDLQIVGAKKYLKKPHFTGGALIFPPAQPAWKRADINELSSLISKYELEAELAYNQLKTDLPHLGVSQWESMMWQLIVQAHVDVEGEWARKFTQTQRDEFAKSGVALPDGSYPIETAEDLANAIHAIGQRSTPQPTIKAHIINRARAVGKTSMLPTSWASD